MMLKLVIIGGGSSYTPEIIEGMIDRHDQFPVTEIALVDIEKGKQKLDVISRLAKRMVKKSGKDITITASLDRRNALKNADFVTSQIRVGGLKAREKDERIPLSYGALGQETNGAGGIFKALRTIPVLLEVSKDMAELCPNAWLINFTNPAGMVTEALLKYGSHKRVIGVCNIPFNMRTGVAEILGCQTEDVEIEFIGLNHFVFGRRVLVKGVDYTSIVIERLKDPSNQYSPANIVSEGWSSTFLSSFMMLPNPYHSYYFKGAEMLEKSLKEYWENGTRAEVVQQVEEELFKKYDDKELTEKPTELEKRGGAFYSDAACNVMTSIYTNKGDIQTVNVQNNGTISDLPNDAVIETNAVMGGEGPRPISIGTLPLSIRGIIQLMKNMEELVIEAAVKGDRERLYQALVINPLVREETLAKDLMEELLDAHKEDLPQFYQQV
ncbi:6-phospho-beta-glucosidase [Shouchella lehensis]|uniref:6-phospho-beta-glucosidase n=2 Tax=Shouchella lehensis TaxID=300825 RepID=A0A060LSC7_9BACI|nr:6-phospho-beta-glucosidase [Shouchella lehensis]AIC93047.1 6-phospho-beta-glucosidase [Shouchella lehensis G1]MBG9783170.1 diacetylchitobiose-6-phosphate hydrolase [Shouchella lehensis]TES49464.1 6-phospho-beta-glucosidase [Shouchella lehensis]